ncbi:hypothetical protein MRX96_016247 [Rhipicephalus microplus]
MKTIHAIAPTQTLQSTSHESKVYTLEIPNTAENQSTTPAESPLLSTPRAFSKATMRAISRRQRSPLEKLRTQKGRVPSRRQLEEDTGALLSQRD